MILNIILVILGYLLGSIPSAVWIGKRFYGIDVREHGSKNAGATNTLRVLGRKAGGIVFLMDFLKGFAAVQLCHFSNFEPNSPGLFILMIVMVVAAVTGHILPIFASFRGGKGVAAVSGAIMAMAPISILLSILIFLIVLSITNYVSLGSIIATFCFPFIAWLLFSHPWPLIVFGFIVFAAILFMHRKNIKRLLDGTESKTYLFKNRKDINLK